MPREIVLQDGVLSAVVKSFEPVELAQIEAEVTSLQGVADAALTTLGDVSAEDAEQLVAAAKQHAEAKGALDDSKSELQVAQGLVATLAPAAEPEAVDEQVEGEETQF